MDGVNDDGDAEPMCRQSAENAGLGAVGVYDLWFDAADEAADVAVCGGVAKGVYLAAEGVDDVKGEAAAAGAVYELAFGSDGGAGGQVDFVPTGMETLDGEEGVFLRSAENEPGY